MGQEEVLWFLKEQKEKNANVWFSAKEVMAGLKQKGYSKGTTDNVRKNLQQLSLYGLIRFRTIGFWSAKMVFHAK